MTPVAEIDQAAAKRLARGAKQRAWLSDLLEDGVMDLADYCSTEGLLSKSDWTAMKRFFTKLEKHGYFVARKVDGRPIGPGQSFLFVDLTFHLANFDPLAGDLIVAMLDYLHTKYASVPYQYARRRALELRVALPAAQEVELAVALLSTWPGDDGKDDFAELVYTVQTCSEQ